MSEPRTKECPECKGTGYFDDGYEEMNCSDCDGTGEIEVDDDEQPIDE